ncbi:MAG: PASTA domain-containing protein [Lachnospiraceae bacterium]|nr:PASTA domain-containing protein [Lachnospiraceae bacterium]MDY5742301.1 PASTA domain-containing protein [Lachnospiraceae bacterium]
MSSDFLSGFTKEKYEKKHEPGQLSIEKQPEVKPQSKAIAAFLAEEDGAETETARATRKNDHTEEAVKDPTYRRRRLIRLGLMALAALIVLLVALFLYHRWTHVTLPDFSGKNFSEARQWGSKYDITFDAKKEFSVGFEGNTIISQVDQPGTRVKKGSVLTLTVSLGADPDEVVALPDFTTMTAEEAQQLIDSQKLAHISIVKEFSDQKEAGRFLKLEFKDKSVTAATYRRRDTAILYFSKGKEVFEKNIAVPDFNGKPKAEAEGWAKTNEIELSFKEASHDKIEDGNIISQSIGAGTKVAKHDKIDITVSRGKAVTVPNYGEYGPENAGEASADMVVQIKQVLTEGLPYGALVSQSIPAGTQLLGKDDKKIIVTYSIGQPYIKDLRGSITEGELQKYFYDEFQSKGAPNISYSVVYVDSHEKKGTVVEQSPYADYLGLSSHIVFQISLGNLTPPASEDKLPGPNEEPKQEQKPTDQLPDTSGKPREATGQSVTNTEAGKPEKSK